SRKSATWAPRMPPRFCVTEESTECDQAGSAGSHVPSTSASQAASAEKTIQRASRARPDRRESSGDGPFLTLREERDGVAGSLAMGPIIIGCCSTKGAQQ